VQQELKVAPGPTGAAGFQGSIGPTGVSGLKGDTGSQGVQGAARAIRNVFWMYFVQLRIAVFGLSCSRADRRRASVTASSSPRPMTIF
jgi:hypothetical protein